jgi:aspartate/methionine/tyrosine aminotransferase
MSFRTPPALAAAELDSYRSLYGHSVREMDRALSAAVSSVNVIDLTHGDTRAFTPPAAAWRDLVAAVEDNTEAYSAYRGSATVRTNLAPRLASLLGRDVDPTTDVILTPGTQGGLFGALSALVHPGDVVAMPSREYFMDERIGAYLGATPYRLPIHQDEYGIITVRDEDLVAARAAGVVGLVFSNPNNPTGGVYSAQSIERLAKWATTNDLWIVADQLYCRLIFDAQGYTHIGSLDGMAERTVTLVGPSKTESMSGYRVAAAVGPRDVINAMEQVMSMSALRTGGYSQHTLRHWMDDDGEWLAERTRDHQAIRDYLLGRLRAIPGVSVATPAGSSYVFPDCSTTPWALAHGSNDDFALAVALKEAGVLVAPGYQFGRDGRGHFRINFSQDSKVIATSCDRIQQVLTNS